MLQASTAVGAIFRRVSVGLTTELKFLGHVTSLIPRILNHQNDWVNHIHTHSSASWTWSVPPKWPLSFSSHTLLIHAIPKPP